MIGALMMPAVTGVRWDDLTDALPAFVTILAMPLTFSIANGLALGLITYPAVKLLAGRGRQVSILTYTLAVLFLVR